jgi:hypothetical protein
VAGCLSHDTKRKLPLCLTSETRLSFLASAGGTCRVHRIMCRVCRPAGPSDQNSTLDIASVGIPEIRRPLTVLSAEDAGGAIAEQLRAGPRGAVGRANQVQQRRRRRGRRQRHHTCRGRRRRRRRRPACSLAQGGTGWISRPARWKLHSCSTAETLCTIHPPHLRNPHRPLCRYPPPVRGRTGRVGRQVGAADTTSRSAPGRADMRTPLSTGRGD